MSARGFDAVPLPRFVQIEPVGQCNLRCEMCPIQYRRDGTPWGPPAFMPLATFRRLLDGFAGAAELHLQGLGEPMMHPAFFDMVAEASARGLEVSTNTNLTLLSARRAALCVTSGLAAIHVSIDGATAPTYESIRRGASFGKVLRNLRRLVEARARLGSPTPHVRIVMVAMRRNLDEIAGVVRIAHAHGVGSVFVQHLCHDYGEAGLPAQYREMRGFYAAESLVDESPARLARSFAAARAAAAATGVELRLPPLEAAAPRTAGRCDWPWRGAYFSFDGAAMPCCMVSTPDRVSLGNAGTRGVAEVWNGERYAAFRAGLANGAPHPVCRSCAVYNGTF